MDQNIRDELILNKGYRINEQFIGCLNEIVCNYRENAGFKINVWCKKTKFTFYNIEEFLKNTSVLSEYIHRMEIEISFKRENSYSYDEIKMEFNNESELFLGNDRISFDFNDSKGYYFLKNQIQNLLNNHSLGYSFISQMALVSPISALIFIFVCWYTDLKNIVFAKSIQYLITAICGLGFVSPMLPGVVKIKRYLFPRYEYEFGVNMYKNQRAKSIRNVLGAGIILSFVVSIVANLVSGFFS